MNHARPILIATRGSALALAQAHRVFDECRQWFPRLRFEIKIVKTTGDKLQTASLARPDASLPKGLFTKELEVALLKHQVDLAVHSLKDLPTDLPAGLRLGAVSKRADVRDVLVYRDGAWLARTPAPVPAPGLKRVPRSRRGFEPGLQLSDLPGEATVATSSTRRKAQLLEHRPDLRVVEIRGNVVTRLQKLADQPALDAMMLAAAGLGRLGFEIGPDARLTGDAVPEGLLATVLAPEVMLPCVGQGALGIEIRESDERIATLCARLNHYATHQCVAAERAFLHAMGGGCHSPVAAYGDLVGEQLRLRAVSFRDGPVKRGEVRGDLAQATLLGQELAARLGTAR